MVMQLNTQPSTALALAADPRYIQRVRYREGQRLRLADLRGEQSYRNATRHRHHLAAHDWGIVDGLELEILAGADAGRPGVAVHPGFAVDGYGRELIIAHTVILDNADLIACLNRAKSKSSKDPALDVWVVYQLSQPSGARRVERTDIMLIDGLGLIRSRNLPPPGVLQSELDFAAHEVAEGDRPAGPWPVYLGTLMQGAQHEITLAMSQPRCYTYVYAGDVSSSDGRVRVTLGEQYLNDPRRFVVRMPDPDQPEQMIERMIINRRGNLALRGNLVINGNLGMTAQPMKDECGQKIAGKSQSLLLRLDPAPTPTAARPWRMYTTTVTEGEGDDQHQYREFRIELYHPGKVGNPSNYRLQIGTWKDTDFMPAFTVGADGRVTVHGIIDPDRRLQPPISTEPSDSRFQDLVRNVNDALYTDKELQLQLRLKSSATTTGNASNRIDVDVVVTNVSNSAAGAISVAVGPIRFYQYIVRIGSLAPQRGQVQTTINRLRPGESRTVTLPILNPIQGRYTVAVMAYGERATGGVTVATQTITFNHS